MTVPESESDIVDSQYETERIDIADEQDSFNAIEVYEKRADFRDKHRKPLIETTKWLNRYIPEVTVPEIRQEETERVFFEVRRSIREGIFKTVPEAFASAKMKRDQMASSRDLYVDEFGKYYVGRMRAGWLKGDYRAVLDLYYEFYDNSMYEEPYQAAVDREINFMLADQVVKFVRSGDCETAIIGMLKFFDIKKITVDDLFDAGMRENECVSLDNAVKKFLVDRFAENPLIYASLREVFEVMGFRNVKDMKDDVRMNVAVGEILGEAALAGMVYLEEAVYVIERLGLLNRTESLSIPFVRHPIIDLLAAAAGVSPEAYVRVRNFVAEKGLIKVSEADRTREVSVKASEFLEKMHQVHPELALLYFNKYVAGDVDVMISDEVLELLQNYVERNVVLSRQGVNILDMDYFIRAQAKTNVDNSNRFLQNHTERELQVFNDFREKYQEALEKFTTEFPALSDFMVAVEDL